LESSRRRSSTFTNQNANGLARNKQATEIRKRLNRAGAHYSVPKLCPRHAFLAF
jgi:hypothetical protein